MKGNVGPPLPFAAQGSRFLFLGGGIAFSMFDKFPEFRQCFLEMRDVYE